MKPKEKAEKLIKRYYRDSDLLVEDLSWIQAKECALIAVDEILNSNPRYPNNVDWDDVGCTHAYYYEAQFEEAEKYWEEVKQEINNL